MGRGPDDAGLLLVLNAGSSSLKFAAYRVDGGIDDRAAEARGQIEWARSGARLRVRDRVGAAIADAALGSIPDDGQAALDVLTGWLRSRYPAASVAGIGHRVVHGGEYFAGPTVVTADILRQLHSLDSLAPLHQPHNLAAIEAALERLPGVAQVACFDTSFHHGHPPVAQLIPLPAEIRRVGVRRYGFHGLSYEYVASVLPQVAPEIERGRVIVAHLGNGTSLCALRDGRSVDSTLGFTALDGLCMGTRPGSIDPGVVLYLFQALGMSVTEVEDVLYRRSGLLGVSGISHDMRELLASSEPSARLAVDYFVHRAVHEIGGLAAALGGLDGLVFTAGIGENSAEIRRRICEGSAWLGVELDDGANARRGPCITKAGSKVSAWVIPTDEELIIARHTRQLLGLGRAGGLTNY